MAQAEKLELVAWAAYRPGMPHRKRVKHYHQPGDLHELTFSCYQRLPLLVSDRRSELLARTIDAAGEAEAIRLVAFVFMPEHVHLLVDPMDVAPRIDRYLARLKRPLSAGVKRELEADGPELLARLMVRERPGKTCFRFWQEGPGYDRNLSCPEAIESAIDYLHANPVRRGLCDRPIDWFWSSARWHADAEGSPDPRLPKLEKLRPGALDRMPWQRGRNHSATVSGGAKS